MTPFIAGDLGPNHLPSLDFGFLLCKISIIIIVTTVADGYEVLMSQYMEAFRPTTNTQVNVHHCSKCYDRLSLSQ